MKSTLSCQTSCLTSWTSGFTMVSTIPVSRVVAHSFNVANIRYTVLVFDSYYLDEAAREGLRAKKVKFIEAVSPASFSVLSHNMVIIVVDQRGKRKGLWNGRKGEVIVYAYTRAGKRYIASSNAYQRVCTKGSTAIVPVCSDYGDTFVPCSDK